MATVRLDPRIKGWCDWCAKPSLTPLSPATLVTPRGTFHQEVCDACALSVAQRAD